MTTIERILAATDTSDGSAATLFYSDVLARKFGAEVTVLQTPKSVLTMAGAGISSRESDAVDEIVAAAYEVDADLIALGIGELGLVEDVIEQSRRPVLAVRGGSRVTVERILCPVNYTAASKEAYDRALLLASAFDASLVIAHTIEGDAGEDRLEAEACRLREWIGDPPYPVRLELLIDHGDAPREIIRHVQSHDVDLLVIGARIDPFANRTLLGRTAGVLVRHAPCAVLTVPTSGGPEWQHAA